MENKNRILFIDILRFIALVFMPIIHVYNVISGIGVFEAGFDETGLELAMNIIYLFSPTIFMFSMGASLILTKKNDPKSFIKRGLKILLISAVFNFIRGLLFSIFYSAAYGGIGFWPFIENIIDWTVGNDILFFAGLFFIIYGFTLKFKNNKDFSLIFTALIFFIISLFIPTGLTTNSTILDSFLGNIILIGEAYFPVLTWTIIPVLGYYFMKGYFKAENKNKFMFKALAISAFTFVALLLVLLLSDTYDSRYLLWGEGEFYFDLPTMVLTLSLNYVYIVVIYFISKLLSKSKALKTLIIFESSNLTKIYLVHWILVIILLFISYFGELPFKNSFSILLFGVLILVISSAVILLFNVIKRKIRENKKA